MFDTDSKENSFISIDNEVVHESIPISLDGFKPVEYNKGDFEGSLVKSLDFSRK